MKKTLTIFFSAISFPNESVFTQNKQLVAFSAPFVVSLRNRACLFKKDDVCEVPSPDSLFSSLLFDSRFQAHWEM